MYPDTQEKSFFTMNVIGALVVGLILGFVIGAFYAKNAVKTTDDSMMGTTTPFITDDTNATSTSGGGSSQGVKGSIGAKNEAIVAEQTAANSVAISKLVLDKSYWVAVRDTVQPGKVSYILGARRLPAGTHDDITISLSRKTQKGSIYDVVLYGDNGNTFNYDPSNVVLIDGTNFALAKFEAK